MESSVTFTAPLSTGRYFPLRWWLALLVLATALPMILLLGYNVDRESKLAVDRARRLAVSMSEVAVTSSKAFLLEQERVLSLLAQRPIVREMDPNHCDPSFEVLTVLRSYLANVATADLDGLSVCSVAKPADGIRKSIGDPTWLKEMVQRNAFVAGRVQKGIYTGRLIMILAYPIRDDKGTVKGALEFAVNLKAFNPVVPESLPPGMVTAIVDKDGTVIARSAEPEKTVGKSLSGLPILTQIQAQGKGLVISPGADGVERLYAFTPVGNTGWTAISGLRTDLLQEEVFERALRTGLFALLILLVSLGLVLVIARKINQPVNALLAAVQGVAEGRFELRAPVAGPLEIANAAGGFNVMLDQLQVFEQQLKQSEVHYRTLFDASPDAIRVICGDRVVALNQAGMRLFGVNAADGLTDKLVYDLIDSRFHDEVRERLRRAIEDKVIVPLANQVLRRPDGTRVDVEVVTAPFEYQGQPAALSVIRDISDRRKAESALRESEARYARVIEGSDEGFWDWDVKRETFKVSPRFETMLGFAPGEWQIKPSEWPTQVHPEDLPHVTASLVRHMKGLSDKHEVEMRAKTRSGDWLWVTLRGKAVVRDEQGRALIMSGAQVDISQRKAAETLIWQQANTDALTGLPNRRMLRDRLDQAIRRCHRDATRMAVFVIDLDLFKEVNDTLGHDQGDLLLAEAARRIERCVRDSDTVARQGGDEFTVVLPALEDLARVEHIAQSILAALSAVFLLGENPVFVSASIGITMYPEDATDVEGLIKRADQALYVAKAAGRNRFSFFTPALQESAQHRLRLTNDLRHALANAQFRVYYQPIVDFRNGDLYKAEALIRWIHPTRGMVSPAEFIPIAEASGFMVEIGDWVFQQAAHQVQTWRSRFRADFQISVNKSPVQFADNGAGQTRWFDCLDQLGLSGDGIAVEITEGMLLASRTDVIEQLQALRSKGIAISLDDFGTGYSSLSYLQKYDIDFVKIDQSFVRNLTPDSKDLALCKAIIVMAHELGMKVIAEGVETAEQHTLLAEAGCDFGQGYLYSRPVPAAQFEALLTTWKAPATRVPEPA